MWQGSQQLEGGGGGESAALIIVCLFGIAPLKVDLPVHAWSPNPTHRQSVKKSLEDLGLEYADLVLVHWPHAWKPGTQEEDSSVTLEETWCAAEGEDEELETTVDATGCHGDVMPHCKRSHSYQMPLPIPLSPSPKLL